MASGYGTDSKFDAPYDLRNNTNDVVNNTDGSIVGYKYFNFDGVEDEDLILLLNLTPEGIDGTIDIMADRPWVSQGGQLLGSISLRADMPQTPTELSADLKGTDKLQGKHAIFFVFKSDTKEQSLCKLHNFVFAN